MHVLLDHLSAVVAGTILLAGVLVLHQRSLVFEREATAFHTARQQSVDFSAWLEHDLSRVGEGVDPAVARYLTLRDSAGLTVEFIFARDTLTFSGTTYQSRTAFNIRYRLEAAGTTRMKGHLTPVYRLRRYVRVGSGVWTPSGQSPGRLTQFQVRPLDRRAQAAASEPEAVFLHVSFGMAPVFDNNSPLDGPLQWSAALRIHPL